jgi:RNA polymerase sigma-70 factor (family 1)
MANLKTLSDKELVDLLKTSDHSAFNEIYHRYFQVLFIHACQKLSDEEKAKDVIQEIFATLWFKRDMDLQIKNLPAYLFTAVRNKVFDIYAHETVQQKHLDSLETFLSSNQPVSTDYRIREKELQTYIDKQIDALPSKMKAVFELSRRGQLSHEEIADQLQTNTNNVSKHINGALKILRTKFDMLFFFF